MTKSTSKRIGSSNYQPSVDANMKATVSHANIRASCYAVDAVTAALSGFHYSSTRAAGKSIQALSKPYGYSGIPEVGTQGQHTPPHSPPLAAQASAVASSKARTSPPSSISSRRGSSPTAQSSFRGAAAAYTITEECERLFCETLRAVFLGERNQCSQDSLVTGALRNENLRQAVMSGLGTPPPDAYAVGSTGCAFVSQWIEVWDYAGGARFRGFMVDGPNVGDKALFIFFDEAVVAKDLKQGLMALIELASISAFACTELMVCFDRVVESSPASKNLLRDLRWVGFELTTLSKWSGGTDTLSDRWLLLGMDVSG